jgi:hypothetical protein
MALALDGHKDLIERPCVPGPRLSALQPIGVILLIIATSLTDGFIGDADAALPQEFLHIAVAQREVCIEPDAMMEELTGETVLLVAFRVSGWSHVDCLS